MSQPPQQSNKYAPDRQTAKQMIAKLNNGAKDEDQHPDLLPAASPPLTATYEAGVTGAEMLILADSTIWPFKGLNRPLRELLDEGLVGPRDLGRQGVHHAGSRREGGRGQGRRIFFLLCAQRAHPAHVRFVAQQPRTFQNRILRRTLFVHLKIQLHLL